MIWTAQAVAHLRRYMATEDYDGPVSWVINRAEQIGSESNGQEVRAVAAELAIVERERLDGKRSAS